MDQEVLEKLQERIGYRFAAPALLRQALCHSSYVNEHRRLGLKDNERLEFLGDAVLELCSSEFIYHAYPEMPEGKMSRLRASLVCEPTLAQCARQIDLPGAIALGRGEEHTGGRERDSIVSDALEMSAIWDNYAPDDVLSMTINAGVNMLILPCVWDAGGLEQIDGMLDALRTQKKEVL